MANFTDTKIKDTYQRVLQIDSGSIQNGYGEQVSASIFSLTASNGFYGDLTGVAAYADALTPGDKMIIGSLDVVGKLTAFELYTQYESSSVIYSSGSTKFGDSLDDTHQFTGSLLFTGSIFNIKGKTTVQSSNVDIFLIKNASETPIFTAKQDGVIVLSTQSIELTNPAPVGGIYFTSSSFYVGLE